MKTMRLTEKDFHNIVKESVNRIIKEAEKLLAPQFEKIEEIRDFNQEKVLKA